jgi:large subunit ribosomal protein L25
MIPAVLYGKQTAPVSLLVDRLEFTKFLRARHGEHGVLTLQVEQDSTPLEKPVLLKRLQHDPLHGEVTHIDFHAVVLTEQIRVKVPVVLKGDAVGVKQDRGVLEHFLREVEVECLPTHIPNQIEHEISQMKIGDAIHVKDLAVPSGARLLSDPEGVIASVLTPKEAKAEEVPAEAVTEPEVIREKKPDAEGEEAAAEKPAKEEKTPEKGEKKDK